MGTPNKVNNLLVKTKKYSVFPFSADVKTTYEPGKVVPFHKCVELFPGESWDSNVQGLTRFLPMQAPVMQRYEQDIVALFVPYRLLWSENAPIFNGEKFFNPATLDADRPAIPRVKMRQLFDSNEPRVTKSIWDYLCYPTFTHIYENFLVPFAMKFSNTAVYASTTQDLDVVSSDGSLSSLVDITALNAHGYIDVLVDNDPLEPQYVRVYFYQYPENVANDFDQEGYSSAICYNFFGWLYEKFPSDVQSVLRTVGIVDPSEVDPDSYEIQLRPGISTLEEVVAGLPGSYTIAGLVDEYLNYLFTSGVLAASSEIKVSLLPWIAYHKAYSDWFLNTSMVDPDHYMAKLYDVVDKMVTGNKTLKEACGGHSLAGTEAAFISNSIGDGDPSPRMWMDDYFTTAYPSASRGSDVNIPVNGTIPQLWTANRLQEFRMRIQLAGKRFIDQIRALWGVEVPDMRLQRTEVVGRWKTHLIVSDVLQNSTSTESSKLGEPAGYATAYGSGKLGHYTAQEPGLLVIVGSVRPTTAYVDQVPRLIYKSDYYDFENPMFDNVGMQAIMMDELYPSLNGSSEVFGYSPRRYAEYMQNSNEIHGDFKLSLDYWHAARKFRQAPSLNPEFVAFTPEDNLNRIFASQEGSNIVSQFFFDMVVSRPLSRYVNYHL